MNFYIEVNPHKKNKSVNHVIRNSGSLWPLSFCCPILLSEFGCEEFDLFFTHICLSKLKSGKSSICSNFLFVLECHCIGHSTVFKVSSYLCFIFSTHAFHLIDIISPRIFKKLLDQHIFGNSSVRSSCNMEFFEYWHFLVFLVCTKSFSGNQSTTRTRSS